MKKISFMLSCCYFLTLPLLAAEEKINLNSATAPEIAHHVKGIGDKRAEAIVKYRAQHGLHGLDDLGNVPGIGKNFVSKHHAELEVAFTLSSAKSR